MLEREKFNVEKRGKYDVKRGKYDANSGKNVFVHKCAWIRELTYVKILPLEEVLVGEK